MFQQKLRLAQSNLISSTLMLLFCCTTVPLVAQDNPQVKKKAVEESILLESGLLPDKRIVVQSNHTETEEKIYEALKHQTLFEFPGNPLEDISDYLATAHNIPIILDEIALADLEIARDHELKLVISKLTLADSLDLLLEPHGLTYIVKNGALIITTIQIAQASTETRVYNVRALKVEDPEALADVLIYTTGDNSWSQFDGPGNLSFFKGSFVIKQNQRTHLEIEAVLNQLLNDMRNSKESPTWSVKKRSEEPASPMQLPRKSGNGIGYF